MLPSDPNDSLLKVVLDWGWAAITGLAVLVWRAQNEKMDMAQMRQAQDVSEARKEFNQRLDAQGLELDRNRLAVEKMFDKLEEHARRSEDRHNELLIALHKGLSRKQDRRSTDE